jgi:hypothetical protein
LKSVNLLKGLTGWNLVKELYREHDKKLQNSFGRIKKTDAVTIVKDGAIPIGAFVKRTRKSASTECLYRGDGRSVPVTKYMSGDTEISKLTCVSKDKKSIELVVKRLERVAKPCSVEVLASDKTSRQILRLAGFVRTGASVNSLGDVYHIYFDKESSPSRKIKVPAAQLVTFSKLPIQNLTKFIAAINRKIDQKIVAFSVHPSSYNKNETWSAIALRGYLPNPFYIESLEESSAYQKKENAEWLKNYKKSQQGLQDTELMKHFPEVQKILDAIIPNSSKCGNAQFKRVRFMRLAPKEGELLRHTDLTDKTLGIEDGKTMRLHVPIRTNPRVLVTQWDLDDKPKSVHMKKAECWYINIRLPHKVINQGSTERIHLVIDVIADSHLREMLK